MTFFLHRKDRCDDGDVYHFMCLDDDKSIHYARVTIECELYIIDDLIEPNTDHEIDRYTIPAEDSVAHVYHTRSEWRLLHHHNANLSSSSSHEDVFCAFVKAGDTYGTVSNHFRKVYKSTKGKYIMFKGQMLRLAE